MKTKKEIVDNWLPRYTGTALADFGEHVLLTNFSNYLELFAAQTGATIVGRDRPMPNATADGITMINFGMGSANAATVMDLLSAISPKSVLLLGKCGGLKRKNQIGDLVLPIAAIRGEGTSDDYLLPEVPALPFSSSGPDRLAPVSRFLVISQQPRRGKRWRQEQSQTQPSACWSWRESRL